MDPDINKYDLNHRVSHHLEDERPEWEDAYRAAWDTYYTLEHIRTILKRAAADPERPAEADPSTIMWFKLMIEQEGVHPLEGGAFRLKYRRDRRRSLPLESPLRLLSALLGRDRGQGVALLAILPEDAAHPQRGLERARPLHLHAISPSSRRATTNSSSSRSITRPPAARRRSRARRLATAFAIPARPAPRRCRRRRRRNDLKAMIEAAQVRAARALIGWSQTKLADAAGVPLSTVDAVRDRRARPRRRPKRVAKMQRRARIGRRRLHSQERRRRGRSAAQGPRGQISRLGRPQRLERRVRRPASAFRIAATRRACREGPSSHVRASPHRRSRRGTRPARRP